MTNGREYEREVVRRLTDPWRDSLSTDQVLLARYVATRDEAAFAELVRRYGPMVLGTCRRVVGQLADADDAFQAVFLVLLRRAGSIREAERLGPWLHRVAWRISTRLRQRRRNVTLPDDLPSVESPNHDWLGAIDAGLAALPEKYRTPMVLCYLHGQSLVEVSQQLNCPTTTVATWLHRGRELLRRRLAKQGLTLPTAFIGAIVVPLPTVLAERAVSLATQQTIPPSVVKLAQTYGGRILMRTWLWTGTCALGLGLLSVGWFGTQADGQDKPPLAPEPKRPSEPVVPPVLNNTQAESPNFRVQATSSRLAGLIAETAERARKDEALRWFDKELPVWEKPVQINIVRRQGGNGGATTFSYRNLQQGDAEAGKKSFTATMELFGDLDVMLTDTLKHEVMHCLLASHFGQPLPRWADEGIALHSESIEQRVRHQQLASYTPEGVTHIPLRELLNAKEYPKNLAMFYAQSYVLCEMLIARKDRATLLTFIADGMNDRWAEAAKKHYGFTSLDEMQKQYARVLANARPTAPETLKTSDGQATFALAQWTGPDQVTIHLTRTKLVRAVNMSRSDDVDEITIVRGQPIKREETIPLLGYRLHTSTTPHPVSLTALKAVDPKGKEIPTATLQTALKIPSPVVLTVGTGLKPDYAKLLQPETIILILAQPLEPQGP